MRQARGRTWRVHLWMILLLASAILSYLSFLGAQSLAQDRSRFKNGFPDDPAFIPIGVWVQDPRDAVAFKAMGINTFVGLWEGPTEAQLAELAKVGLYAVAAQNDVALKSPNAHVVKAWMHDDEPDNAQPLAGGGYGDCILPDQVLSRFSALRARDPTRPVLLNFGQGVANKSWRGRGRLCGSIGHDEYYGQASRGCDIVSFDIYPVTSEQSHVHGRLELVAEGVGNLGRWATSDQRIWAIIGTTRISHPRRRPTAAEVRAMAWMAIVKGARGLVYFVHEWQPRFSSNAVLRYPDMVTALIELNSEIHGLASVINSARRVTVTANPPIVAPMARIIDDNTLYVFAVNLSDRSGRVTLKLDTNISSTGFVLGESRSVKLELGTLEDDFAAYGVHLFQFKGR